MKRRVLFAFLMCFLALALSLGAQQLKPGVYNAITDVPGILVGSYTEKNTGTTVIICPPNTVGGVDVRGSAPGTRETDLLRPTDLVNKVNAVVLSGGSAFGLAAADGVMGWLEQRKMGWPIGGGNVVPIVPAAILFDVARFGRTAQENPNASFGAKACDAAKTGAVTMGNVGAGAGAVSGGLKGGLGTASVDLGNGVIVGAIVAINSGGSTVNPKTGELYARYLELGDEFAVLKKTAQGPFVSEEIAFAFPSDPIRNTTIAVVATNVQLTKAQAQKIAQMAHDGYARAINPVHTMFDGDTIFALGTGELSAEVLQGRATWGNMEANINKIGAAAADAISRAIVHAMINATSLGTVKSYKEAFPQAFK